MSPYSSLSRRDDAHIVFSVADDGVGLVDGTNQDDTKGLGMRLVRVLAGQLGASLNVRDRRPGYETEVVVPLTGNH